METRMAPLTRRGIRVYSERAVDESCLRGKRAIMRRMGHNQIWRFALIADAGLIKALAG